MVIPGIIPVAIAVAISVAAELLVRHGVWGWLLNVLLGLLGIWVVLNLLTWRMPGDLGIGGVPILTSALGAALNELILGPLLPRDDRDF